MDDGVDGVERGHVALELAEVGHIGFAPVELVVVEAGFAAAQAHHVPAGGK